MARFSGIPVETGSPVAGPRFKGVPVQLDAADTTSPAAAAARGPQFKAAYDRYLADMGGLSGDQPAPESGNVISGADAIRQTLGLKPEKSPEQTYTGAATTWLEHAISDLPVVGPYIQKGSDLLGTEIYGRLTGQDPEKMRADIQKRREQRTADYPLSSVSGALGGNIAALGPVGATEAGAAVLGLKGANLGARAVNSGLSMSGINMADTLARGGDGAQALESGAIGLGLGLGLPVVGAGIGKTVEAGGSLLSRLLGSAGAPAKEAERRLGAALTRDAGAGMTAADEASAQAANVPVMNVDRGGETTRALARSVANQLPEARATIERTANDRFSGQGQRAVEFIRKITGGSVDDVALQNRLSDAAKATNRPAYRKAYQEGSDLVMTPELERLTGSPAVVSAMKEAIKTGKDRSIREGMGTFNPAVSITDDGRILFNRTKPGGGTTFPDLQFWDYTKRELDDMASAAGRAGRKGEADTLGGLAKSLRDELDRVVPSYKQARQGAAAFFGAENALDAGRQFARSPRSIPEARQAYAKLNEAERRAFGTGYASELIDRIKASPDRSNVINSVFKNQAARESMELALGPQRARQLEAYVRVEDMVDRLRGAMGNSTTARQLVELGIGGAGGFALTGDWKGALTGAALVRGPRYLQGKIEQNVMRELGKLLTTDDPALVQRLILNASASPKYMQALDNIGRALQIPTRAAITQANRPQ